MYFYSSVFYCKLNYTDITIFSIEKKRNVCLYVYIFATNKSNFPHNWIRWMNFYAAFMTLLVRISALFVRCRGFKLVVSREYVRNVFSEVITLFAYMFHPNKACCSASAVPLRHNGSVSLGSLRTDYLKLVAIICRRSFEIVLQLFNTVCNVSHLFWRNKGIGDS